MLASWQVCPRFPVVAGGRGFYFHLDKKYVGIFAYIGINPYLCGVINEQPKTWGQHGKFCNRNMKRFGNNSGYVGYSMSKRAARAKAAGKFPKTEFKREYGVSTKLFNILNRLHIVSATEWHHTSMYGNQTDFYEWRSEDDINTLDSHKSEINALVRRIKSEPNMEDYEATREGMDQWEEDLKAFYDTRDAIINQIESIFNED